MSTTNLPFVQQQMIQYGMSVYLAFGLIGNIFNCIVFTHHSYRRTPSSIYFLSLSIFGIIYLTWSIPPFIYALNHSDLQTQSVFYCKVRQYASLCLGQCLRYFVVFACADRFYSTRMNIHIRSLSSIPVATKSVIITIVVCFLINIHAPLNFDIRNGICGVLNLYKLFFSIYQIIVVGILPPVLMSIFSILTIRSLHQRHGFLRRLKQKDRYLFRMVMAEVAANVSTSIPFSINLVYTAATFYTANKSSQRVEIESFISFVTQFLVYFTGVVPFYLYIITSKPFRRRFIYILIEFWKKCFLRHIRIIPANAQNNIPMNNY